MSRERIDPAMLNGDLPLSGAENAAYLEYHRVRNRRLAAESRAAGVRTRVSPVWGVGATGGSSPARAMLDAFYSSLAGRLFRAHYGGPVTIVDLGCGSGGRIRAFADAGFTGEYIGIDHVESTKWPRAAVGGLRPRMIAADLHTFDERSLPPIDLLISTTALEHLRDDAGIIGRFAACLAPGGVQAHFVPGEAALALYGKHGWRQYSPICLRRLFPSGVIYRFGGVFSNELHRRAIFEPSRAGRSVMSERWPRAYGWLRAGSLLLDRLTGCRSPSMYAVVTEPAEGLGMRRRALRPLAEAA